MSTHQGCIYNKKKKKRYKKPLAVFIVTLSSVAFAPTFFPSESRLQCFLSSQQLDALFDTDEAVKSSQKSLRSLSNYNGLSTPPLQQVHRAE